MLSWLPILPIYVIARICAELSERRRRRAERDQAWADAWDEEWVHR
ncbi:hypothetical protein [Gordonia soli]|nr:hypothetical protein [Gordonia soli]